LRIGGLQKNSLIDFPGKVSCVIFSVGCNFRCPYCHNPQLVNNSSGTCSEMEILEFLEQRKGWLDGVVISGGEPTLHADISSFCRKVKRMGFPVKLDTNGSNPVVLENLISRGDLDYIAMDIKTDPVRYAPVIAETCDPESILGSIRMIMNSPIPYEFKTTCVKPLVDESIMDIITGLIRGAGRYALQRFHGENVLNPDFFKNEGTAVGEEEFLKFKALAQNRVKECIIR
jgi:pyruvate formate lyase activating enzyme